MAGILFILDIVAFVVVAWWAYTRSKPGAESPETGLLGMRSGEGHESRAKARRPSWKASAPRVSDLRSGPGKAPRFNRSEPRWKASRSRPQPPA
jgi:hypothetical protein